MKYVLDYKKYEQLAEQAVAEGQVLLENRNDVLPIKKGSTVALFGRIQTHYYKSGTGSGGMVNVNRVIGIPEAIREAYKKNKSIRLYEPLYDIYTEWEKTHPFDLGVGWGQEPWSQEEMPLTDKIVKDAAAHSDYAIAIIGRSAGEDQDNKNEPGSYLLTENEFNMLKIVRRHFKRLIVILNVGNIMDMRFVKDIAPDAVLYAWQGGMIGGRGTVDVLTGRVSPSGSLSDTIAEKISDYPSDKNFGDPKEAVYAEDIFVGYRYFETFKKDKVLYPFGYGLSYTSFDITLDKAYLTDNSAGTKPKKASASLEASPGTAISLDITVKNTGKLPGKKTVMLYIEAPNGLLGKPSRVLASFKKTGELKPGASEKLRMIIPFKNFASFDETGKCGLGTGFILEKGEYKLYIGGDVRSASYTASVDLSENLLIEKLENALGPVKPFKRMCAVPASAKSSDSVKISYENAPVRNDTQKERRLKRLPKELKITGDKGYKLKDVRDGKVTMDDFITQLSVEELCTIIRGEGMGSAQVTAGTASAFGGISSALHSYGIPIGCMDDGPSGMRLDSGVTAFSLPNGTLLACTCNPELVTELFEMLGMEMLKNRVDVILGPGMNIHRHPLNGRNFEYLSEDPYLTGVIAAAQFKGLQRMHVSGTMKHFACNNQEYGRQEVNPVVSERALREIYLKGFEIAAREGADAVMTTYCQINGVWTAGNYDLNTTILREQWGFDGITMTDWWANISEEGAAQNKTNFAAMVRAQNDMYMCVPGALADVGDNALSSAKDGSLTTGELQRSAKNICGFLMKYAPFIREYEEAIEVETKNAGVESDERLLEIEYHKIGDTGSIDLENVTVKRGGDWYFGIDLEDLGDYEVTLTGRGMFNNEIAQMSVVLFIHTLPACSFTFHGNGMWTPVMQNMRFLNKKNIMHFHFGMDGLELQEIRFKKTGYIA